MLIGAEEIDIITNLKVKERYRKEYPNKNSMTIWKAGEDLYTYSFHYVGRNTVSKANVSLKTLIKDWFHLINS